MHTYTPKLIVILGPTTSGKTELSLYLAKKFGGYIISADSRQIYQGMDIGTGKLSGGKWKITKGKKVLYFQGIPHYMIDIVKPDQEYTVAQYQEEINQIIQENAPQIPFLVGGTGLYISAIIDGLKIPRIPPDKKLRKKLEKKTNSKLFKELKKLDPLTAQRIDPQNKRRLIRALEVCLKTGKPFSSLQRKKKPNYDVLQIGLSVPREELYKRINKRVDTMVRDGLIAEIKKMIKNVGSIVAKPWGTKMPVGAGFPRPPTPKGAETAPLQWTMEPRLAWNLPAMSGLGYKQIGMYLRGEISLAQAIKLIKRETWHYARRQLTWFRRDRRIKWIENKIVGARFIAPIKEAEKLVKEFLKK